MDEQKYTIILRHDTSTMWLVNNPILALGEYGVEDDTHKVKRGNGESTWSELIYEDFGLQYIVTYANLSGEIKDNEALSELFDSKLSISVLNDVENTLVSSITTTYGKNDEIAKVTKTYKNIDNGAVSKNSTTIKSEDNTVQGYWSVDESGNKILNLIAVCSITDYQPRHRYYKDQLCYYKNKIYRAYRDIDADTKFNDGQWVLLASLHAIDIKYSNLKSGMAAENVNDAIDELKRLDEKKLPKSTEPDSVYGTTDLGEQVMIPKDDLRKVDTVNRKKADLNKNVQLDAGEINYNDKQPELGSVRKVLDDKVDKNFAGEGARIVRDVSFEYDETNGHITLIEDKVSPTDGTAAREEKEINVVSEKELSDTANSLNQTIVNVANDLDTTISNNKKEINDRVDNEVKTLNDRVSKEVNDLTDTMVTMVNETNEHIDTEVTRLDKKIDDTKTELDTKFTDMHHSLNDAVVTMVNETNDRIDDLTEKTTADKEELNTKIDNNKQDIEQKLQETETKLKHNIDINDGEINGRVTNEVKRLNDRITQEANDLNDTIITMNNEVLETIDQTETRLNEKISNNKQDIEQKLNNTKTELETTIAANKTDIEQKLSDTDEKLQKNIDDNQADTTKNLTTKIDKSISDTLLVNIEASAVSREPTIKMTHRDVESHKDIITHLHFKSQGRIKTSFVDEDHILIDSNEIDDLLDDHTDTLNSHNNRITTNEQNIATLDTRVTTNDEEIAAIKRYNIVQDEHIEEQRLKLIDHDERILANRHDIINLLADVGANTQHLAEHDELLTDLAAKQLATTKQVEINKDNIENNLIPRVTSLESDKINKSISNKLVSDITSGNLIGNEIINLVREDVDTNTGIKSTNNLKVISSDNTLVAKMLDDGTIDLATNLDTDVNYFITSETLNTTIPYDNVVSLDSLTHTDKENLEVQDIISDPEGTWARVKSIDTEAGTCIAVTFKKHAQAVWGTIKGNISEQQDLQAEFASRDDINITHATFSSSSSDSKANGSFTLELFNVNNTAIHNSKCTIYSSNIDIESDNAWGLKLNTNSENVSFAPETSGLTSTKLAPAIREIKELIDTEIDDRKFADDEVRQDLGGEISNITNDIININDTITTINNTLNELPSQYAPKITDTNIIYGTDRHGDTIAISKDELGKVKTVNSKEPDTNGNILLNASDINYIFPQGITSQRTKSLDEVLEIIYGQFEIGMRVLNSRISRYNLNSNYTVTEQYELLTTNGTNDTRNVSPRFVYIDNYENMTILARIKTDFTSQNDTTVSVYENLMRDVKLGHLELVGIPQTTPDPTEIAQVTDDTGLAKVVAKGNPDIADDEQQDLDIDITNNSASDTLIVTDSTPTSIVDMNKTVSVTSTETMSISASKNDIVTKLNGLTFSFESTIEDGPEVMDILNQVDGGSDTYDGLGGTETEVEAILDEILGNNAE